MNKLYMSAAGEIRTEAYWRDWTGATWRYINATNHPSNYLQKPADAFERMAKVLKLKEVID